MQPPPAALNLPAQEAIARAVEGVVSRFPRVAAAYLFGSYARGTARDESDVDIGLVFTEPPDQAAFDRLAIELESEISRALGVERVDVINLEVQGPLFAHEVLCEGIRLFERDRARRVDFESDTVSRAIDFRPTYELATENRAKAMRRALRASGLIKAKSS